MTVEEAENGTLERQPNPAERRAVERKWEAALELKRMHLSWIEIADVLGYSSARAAQVAVEKALAANMKDEDTGFLRTLVSQKLERLMRSTDKKANDQNSPEHLPAVGKQRELIADFIKLWGLQAPTEIAIKTPSQAELEQFVTQITGVHALEEATDIFEGEIVEDEEPESA